MEGHWSLLRKIKDPIHYLAAPLTGFLEEEIAFYRTLPIDDDQKNSLQLAATPNYWNRNEKAFEGVSAYQLGQKLYESR